MKIIRVYKCICFVVVSLLITSCAIPKALVPNISFLKGAGDSPPITNNQDAYALDEEKRVLHLYVTVKSGSLFNQDEGDASILLQEGNENGPLEGYFGYGLNEANAKLKIVGQKSNQPHLNSYKITLNDPTQPLHGNIVLNLNKNLTDSTRLKNKLAFDYYKKINNIVSARTQFVVLNVKDSDGNQRFIDCGLYTNVEELDAFYLQNHGLDPEGVLYNVIFFEFKEVADNRGEIGYDKENFENIIEVRANSDTDKLFKLLDNMDNKNLSNEGVFSAHFNKENYLSWLATNIIMGNLDAYASNLVIYSPKSSQTWYLLPWDNATSLGYYKQDDNEGVELPLYRTGISNYWGSGIHRRFLSIPGSVDRLSEKIEELSAIINPDNTLSMLNEYYSLVGSYIGKSPQEMDAEFKRIADETQKNIERYYNSLELIMPAFTIGPLDRDADHGFTCQSGVSLKGGGVYYDFILGLDPEFNTVLEQIDDSAVNEFFVRRLAPGTYYYKIALKNDNGDIQLSFDRHIENDKVYYGVRQVVIKKKKGINISVHFDQRLN